MDRTQIWPLGASGLCTNDFIPKEKFVAAGASLQFIFGMGAMAGPFLCSIFMGMVGPNGFFIFLLFFHSIIGAYGVYRSKVRPVIENPDSQFVAMPQSITPAGIELNPSTEPRCELREFNDYRQRRFVCVIV